MGVVITATVVLMDGTMAKITRIAIAPISNALILGIFFFGTGFPIPFQ